MAKSSKYPVSNIPRNHRTSTFDQKNGAKNHALKADLPSEAVFLVQWQLL